jgi:hypothetical protein
MKPGFSIEIEVCFLALKRRMAPDGAGWRLRHWKLCAAVRSGPELAFWTTAKRCCSRRPGGWWNLTGRARYDYADERS